MDQSKWRGAAVRVAMLFGLAIGLAGCVGQIERPSLGGGTATYATSLTYLEAARVNIDKKTRERAELELATKVGVAAGVAGTGVNAIFQGNRQSTLGFVTLGALSYATNQNFVPPSYSGIYTAALGNLTCIRSAAAQAHGPYEELDRRKIIIQGLLAQLRQDIAEVDRSPDPSLYVLVADPARAAIPATEALLAQIAGVSDSVVAEAVIGGVNDTIDVTNAQLVTNAPSIDAIAASGKLFISAFDQGLAFRTAASDAAAKLVDATGVGHSQYPLNDRLVEHQLALRQQLDAVNTLLATLGKVQMTTCRPQFAANSDKIVLLAGASVDLNAGETISLNTASGEIVYAEWIGVTPTDVTANFDGVLKLTAKPDAAAKSYSLRVIGGAKKPSDALVVNVKAKPAAPAAQNGNPPPQQNANAPAQQANDGNGRPPPPPPRKKQDGKE